MSDRPVPAKKLREWWKALEPRTGSEEQATMSDQVKAPMSYLLDGLTLATGAFALGILDRVLDGPPEETHARVVREREATIEAMRAARLKAPMSYLADGLTLAFAAIVLDGPPEETHARVVREREVTIEAMRAAGWRGK